MATQVRRTFSVASPKHRFGRSILDSTFLLSSLFLPQGFAVGTTLIGVAVLLNGAMEELERLNEEERQTK